MSDPSLVIVCDGQRVEIALSNLVANAVKFVQAGGRVLVHVGAGKGRVKFSVQDNGPGISAEEQPLIFERFYRGKGATGDGAGLGLAIARSVARAHGGTVSVQSAPGIGSTFTLEIPWRPRLDPAAGRHASPTVAPRLDPSLGGTHTHACALDSPLMPYSGPGGMGTGARPAPRSSEWPWPRGSARDTNGLTVLEGMHYAVRSASLPVTEDLQMYTRWSGTGTHTIGVSIVDRSTGNSIAETSDDLDFGNDPVTYFTHDFSGTRFPHRRRVRHRGDRSTAEGGGVRVLRQRG